MKIEIRINPICVQVTLYDKLGKPIDGRPFHYRDFDKPEINAAHYAEGIQLGLRAHGTHAEIIKL